MKFVSVGGGPAGLYFSILMKEADPAHEVLVLERNKPDDTFGFGVVFSDATMDELGAAEPTTHHEITSRFYHWDDIDIYYQGEVISSTGHGFAGLSRQTLLHILQERCHELGVDLRFETEVDDLSPYADADLILAADGANSWVRAEYEEHFRPSVDMRPNRFVWLGTTKPFPAFTFYFKPTEHGLWRVHAYQYVEEGSPEPEILNGISTFIVEATEDTWRAAGLDGASEAETIAFCEELFAEELEGHSLIANMSLWRSFPTIKAERWYHDNIVLIGDAAHTAHFSVGSGTRLAMVDAIELSRAIVENCGDLSRALPSYEEARRPGVESLQRAAKTSMMWFEGTERYMDTEPIQFGFNLTTRSLRITHENLRMRDPVFLEKVDAWFARKAAEQTGVEVPAPPPPPMFTPFRVRDLLLSNRVAVSPMCQYLAEDGTPNDWHLVHLGTRAMGGAGLVFTEMTDVSREARISHGCTGMYKPEHVGAWSRIVDFIHENSAAKVAIQLGHAGRKGSTKLAWEGMDEPLPEGNWPIISASPIPYFPQSQIPQEMTREEMDQVRDDFVRAAELSEQADFDWLEIHFAHGYLLASFISPLTNDRSDEYGGSLQNRMRYPLELLDAVRSVWSEKPLSVRISAVDWAPGGMEADDAVAVAEMLKARGVDIVDVSAGQTVPYARPEYGRQFQTPFSDRIRHETGIATMAVGNISSYMDVNTILAAGRADLCLMARAHLWDPYWTRHMAYELGYDLPWPGPYSTLEGFTPRLGLKEEDK